MIEFEATEDAEVLTKNLGKKFGYFTTNNDPQVKQQPGELQGLHLRNRRHRAGPGRGQRPTSPLPTPTLAAGASTPSPASGVTPTSTPACASASRPRAGYSKNDGKWLVRSVSHKADRQSYQTQLALSRPKNWVAGGGIPYRPFWEEDMTTTRARPYLQESQGKWLSSWRTT